MWSLERGFRFTVVSNDGESIANSPKKDSRLEHDVTGTYGGPVVHHNAESFAHRRTHHLETAGAKHEKIEVNSRF